MGIRLLIVQYAGDYREAVQRFMSGGDETYYAQKYSVDAVAEIGRKVNEAATLCCLTKESYNEILDNGVRGIGTGFIDKVDIKKLLNLIEDYQPTHLILRTPIKEVINWAIKARIKILLILADSWNSKGLKNKILNYKLANLLNKKPIDWVGNHGVSASISLVKIGVNPDKIIPWDWPHPITPDSFLPKKFKSDKNTWEIVYVGAIQEAKGIGDVIEAISKLIAKGFSIKLKVAGKGDVESWILKARQLQIEDCVDFLGLVPNKTIIPLMREADLVLVPSRHDYPEGFPMTIYEALCSRTPIIASDHPMFINKLIHRTNSLIFPAKNSNALAECIEELLSNPQLYELFSFNSYETWQSLQIPIKWYALVNCWLFDSPENKQKLFENRLSSGKYKEFVKKINF